MSNWVLNEDRVLESQISYTPNVYQFYSVIENLYKRMKLFLRRWYDSDTLFKLDLF